MQGTVNLMRWSYQQGEIYYQITVDSERIGGGRSVFGPYLNIPLKVEVKNNGTFGDVTDLFMVGGYLGWMTENHPTFPIPTQIISPNRDELFIYLTDSQLVAMEDVRAGQGALLALRLTGAASPPANAIQYTPVPPPGNKQPVQPVTLPLHQTMAVRDSGDNAMRLRIHRDQWLQILSNIGFGTKHVVELPEPNLPSSKQQWKEVLRVFGVAVAYHRGGSYEQSIQDCRKVVEGVRTVLCDAWGIKIQGGKGFANSTKEIEARLVSAWGEDEKERVQALTSLLNAAWQWGSVPHHFGAQIPLREESHFTIELSSSLITYAAQLLDAFPRPITSG